MTDPLKLLRVRIEVESFCRAARKDYGAAELAKILFAGADLRDAQRLIEEAICASARKTRNLKETL